VEVDAQMSVCSDLADYQWLTGREAAAYLAEVAVSDAPIHTAIERLRRSLSAARAHLLLQQLELRRRAKEKFTFADRMFFTRVGLEQSTDEWVACYKASRFAGLKDGASAPLAIVDLCCGIGGDLVAFSKCGTVVGVDSNPIAAHFAQANISLVDAVDRVKIVAARVEDFELDAAAAWHIDPDRRAAGRRTTSLDSFQPGLDTMEKLISQVPHAGVKLAPATKVPAHWADRCELEWISRDGECRQLVAWHGALARLPGRRRATILANVASQTRGTAQNCAPCARSDSGTMPRTITGRADEHVPISDEFGDYVSDIDPAIRAAHLQGALAAELNLSALAAGPSYLTGTSPIIDATVSVFKIENVLPLRVRTISQHLRERGIGRLEIKKRGVDIDPETLRRKLKLRGNNAATLLITPIGGRPAAIVAQRI
jgi:hypothetical protein